MAPGLPSSNVPPVPTASPPPPRELPPPGGTPTEVGVVAAETVVSGLPVPTPRPPGFAAKAYEPVRAAARAATSS
jgi:hypothetical protein